jgi:hypothetical protein
MTDVLKKFGVSGGVGFLVGLLAVYWIQPTTGPGTALLIIICIIGCGVIGGLLNYLFGNFRAAAVSQQSAVATSSFVDDDERSG